VTPENRREAIRAELTRGDEARRAAAVLSREGLLRDAISRTYYAALHYARALLLTKDEEPMTHEGVLRRVSFHFVKTGLMTVEEGKILGRLHKLREEADYGVEREYRRSEVGEEVQNLDRFRKAVERILDSLGVTPSPGA
jgi:uncharacterized protein (UPF0332 family)